MTPRIGSQYQTMPRHHLRTSVVIASGNMSAIDLSGLNATLRDLITQMGKARVDRYERQGWFDSSPGSANKLVCNMQSYIVALALAKQGYNASIAVGADHNHAVVVIENKGNLYAADPRMQIPFKAVSKQELKAMLGLFSLFKYPQEYKLLNVRQAHHNDVAKRIMLVLNEHKVQASEIRYLLRDALSR
jgi:hypothetical protein